jgi:hypothetical protein
MFMCCNSHVQAVSQDTQVWLEEKNQLIQAHNEAKVKLISEIQGLRKALTPTAEQAHVDFKRSEYLRSALEEEVVNTHIQNDNLKVRSCRSVLLLVLLILF